MGKYFGTDGFRGEAGVTLTALHAYKTGLILGYLFGRKKGKCRAVIGKDTRLSSYMLEYAMVAGLTAAGADAYILHVTTTPSVSYITRCDDFDIGIMISASHNKFYDNGIKLVNSLGEKMDDGVLKVIEDYLDSDEQLPLASGVNIGRTVDYVSGRNRYIGHLISLSTCSYKGLKVGLDAANGSAWQIARSVFDSLGAKTFVIGDSPNGTNVNDGVGSTHIKRLSELVKSNSLDIGFAFDGDADRCLCVDERGEAYTGDEELYILAGYLLSRGELAEERVVCTTMNGGGLIDSLKAKGIACTITDVGDKNVYDQMLKTHAALGGERSGHIIMTKYGTTGDGLVTAIMIMEAMVESKGKLSALLKGYSSYPQSLISVKVQNKRIISAICGEIESVKKDYGVRLVVRPSGTERVIRVLAEGRDKRACDGACAALKSIIERCDGGM